LTRSKAVLAIDQGTSGTKAIVVDPERGVLGVGEVLVRPSYGPDGSVEQDPTALLASVLAAGREALANAAEPVCAIGLANQGETVLAWNRKTGAPLTDAIVWQDRRAASVCERLKPQAAALESLTGLPLDAYFAAPKMAWVRERLTREGVVTTSDVWLLHQLTGAFVTDASTASRTMLLDLDSTDWSPEAVEIFGMSGEDLPTVVDSAGVVGETDVFGLRLPVSGLLVDQQAALLAHGCLSPGESKCTFGTGAFLLTNTGAEPYRVGGGLVPSVAWRLRGMPSYCLDGQVYTVASAVRWLIDLGIIASAEELDKVGANVDDSGGVTFIPAFAGLAAPWWRGDIRASLTGLGLETTSGHLVRALFDGIAAQVVALVDAAGKAVGAPLSRLRVDGGLTRSQLLMQTQADLLQIPVEVYGSLDATAHGVATAARLGLMDEPDLDTVLPSWAPVAIYEPQVSSSQAQETLARHRDAVTRLLDMES